MQNRYVGDVGDFGKFRLLRWLCGKPELAPNCPASPTGRLKLGVVWYLNEPDSKEEANSDGKRIEYLHNTKRDNFRDCDSYLYNKLHYLVKVRKNRTVQEVRQRNFLPCDWKHYFEESLSYTNNQTPQCREERRNRWLNIALEVTKKSQIVFVDPDNGIASKGWRGGVSQTHTYIGELRDLARHNGKKSLVIYCHLNREGTVTEQIRRMSNLLHSRLEPNRLWALWFRRGTARAYFITAATPEHSLMLEGRLKSFLNSPWAKHFVPVDTSILLSQEPCLP